MVRGISKFASLFSLAIFALAWLAGPCAGQKEFFPDHPDVVDMVRRGLNFLESTRLPAETGYQVLTALAIVESSKRYEATIPVDNPIVSRTVDTILREMADGTLQRTDAIYYPCLALILLCDVGDEKYKDQINEIIKLIVDRQQSSGAFTYLRRDGENRGDTSQTQYAALALWVAYEHGFNLPIETPQKALQWLMDVNQPNGGWLYEYRDNRGLSSGRFTLSIQAACCGTVYLLSDFLQLNRNSRSKSAREKAIADQAGFGTALPPSVSLYVAPKQDGAFEPIKNSDGPLARVDAGQLGNVKRKSNEFLADNFSIAIERWGYYYLYALERYAFFREKAEGSVEEIPDWYDQGVRHLKTQQNADGSFKQGGGLEGETSLAETTCFAVLFLVRSSEVLILPGGKGPAAGGLGLKSNVRLDVADGGRIKTFDVVRGLADVMELLGSDEIDEQQFELIQDALGKSITQLAENKTRTQREQLQYMRGLVSDRNYFRRLIAVKLLSRQQDMDNVPALIYALGDPDHRVCIEAHNGLRLISRKLDSIRVADERDLLEYQRVKQEWTEWFLKIRPGAELLD